MDPCVCFKRTVWGWLDTPKLMTSILNNPLLKLGHDIHKKKIPRLYKKCWGCVETLSSNICQDTLFEGDILLRGETSSREDLLLLLEDPNLLWPRGEVGRFKDQCFQIRLQVFYAFDSLSQFTVEEKGLVAATMATIEEKTGCVQFRQFDKLSQFFHRHWGR